MSKGGGSRTILPLHYMLMEFIWAHAYKIKIIMRDSGVAEWIKRGEVWLGVDIYG